MMSDKRKTITFETFRDLGDYERHSLERSSPDAFNGVVTVRKWRVTFDPVQEPDSVIAERLQSLWDHCDNHHHWSPLRAYAKRIGYELQGDAGSKRRTK